MSRPASCTATSSSAAASPCTSSRRRPTVGTGGVQRCLRSPLPEAFAHTGLRAPFAFPDGSVVDWVLTPDGWAARYATQAWT